MIRAKDAKSARRFDEQQRNQVTKKKELLWLHRFTREATAMCLVLSAKP
jgi:hypothetical protein